jgi:acyl carrier protein
MSNEEILKTIQELVAEQFAIDPEKITLETSFEDDLSADSVDLVELEMSMEDEFGISEVQEDELSALKTVGDAVRFVAGKLNR